MRRGVCGAPVAANPVAGSRLPHDAAMKRHTRLQSRGFCAGTKRANKLIMSPEKVCERHDDTQGSTDVRSFRGAKSSNRHGLSVTWDREADPGRDTGHSVRDESEAVYSSAPNRRRSAKRMS